MQIRDLEERIRKIAREELKLAALPEVGNSANGELLLDSMAFLELLLALEEAFGISLIDAELELEQRIEDLQSLARLVGERLAQEGPGGGFL